MKIDLILSDKWKDYELIDCGDEQRLERWGSIVLIRPDPQVLWPKTLKKEWSLADATYIRSSAGGGRWEYHNDLPEIWNISYADMTLKLQLMGFKHTGVFPEQAANWDFIADKVKNKNNPNVLNLFGYTGVATVAAAKSGANVCHVDAAKGMLTWCKENCENSGVQDGLVRLIPEDCLKFVQRESRRGKTYDAIIMDPPSFGRGSKGEVWKLENNFWQLLCACKDIFSVDPLFLLINSYTAGISSLVLANMVSALNINLPNTTSGELGLPYLKGKKVLPCGIYLRAEK